MSEAAQVALIAGAIGVLNLGVTLWFNKRTRQIDLEARARERSEDNREWYRRALFEKRLQVLQEAYEWLMKINRALNLSEPKNPQAPWTLTLKQTCFDAREWYDRRAVLMYDGLPESSEFVGLINSAAEYSVDNEGQGVWSSYERASKEVRRRLDEILASLDREQ